MTGSSAHALVALLAAAAGGPGAAGRADGGGSRHATGLAQAAAAPGDAVVGRRKLGESVRGRPIMAYRLGERDEKTVVLFSTMHGDEPRTRQILLSLREGRPIRGVNLWVVPTYNPDGLARGTRKNAHGVDLNRNFPYRWADLDGGYESGPRPRSEPETRAVVALPRGRASRTGS